jgi:L-alanine-DL-glutamate epimerase-like enolase superfamily enzyme
VIVTGVRVVTCDVPLPRPIVMGELRFDSREYVLAVVETDAGVSGVGFGMTRNAPVGAMIARNVAPLVVGEDPLFIERLWHRVYDRNLTIGGRGAFMRALSAVDIALWDIKAQVAGLPIWQLLGGARSLVPISIAGGYPLAGRDDDDLATELDDYAARGFATVKIAAGELADDTTRIRVAVEALAGRSRLAYDAHWAWRTLVDVVPTVSTWAELGLWFLEDPFAPELVFLAPRLREATGLPMALGEDAVGRWAFDRLIADTAPDILRIDATTMGGLSEAAKVCAMASARAIPVIPHVFPEIHGHLGAAFPIVSAVELTLPEYELEGLYRLFERWVDIDGGELVAPTSPGLGLTIDWQTVDRYTVESTRVVA